MAKLAESYKELVIDGETIKEESTYNGLDAEDDFGAVNDWSVFVWGVLRFFGVGVVEFESEVGNVVVYC